MTGIVEFIQKNGMCCRMLFSRACNMAGAIGLKPMRLDLMRC